MNVHQVFENWSDIKQRERAYMMYSQNYTSKKSKTTNLTQRNLLFGNRN